ncbi:hypothetical protein C8Q78DRAFT_700286 [Trametes maxima]|nr:hypothetical protein C8Q78DRAFT_700286 [Trametes maxima]
MIASAGCGIKTLRGPVKIHVRVGLQSRQHRGGNCMRYSTGEWTEPCSHSFREDTAMMCRNVTQRIGNQKGGARYLRRSQTANFDSKGRHSKFLPPNAESSGMLGLRDEAQDRHREQMEKIILPRSHPRTLAQPV